MIVATRQVIAGDGLAPAASELDALGARLDGTLLLPGSPGYDEARRVVNITLDRHPLAIVRAASALDVARAVNFARDHGLPLAVRGGGHSLAGYSVIDDAVLVDLSHMRQVDVDPEARIARVQGGARSGDLAGPANQHGLALSTGDTASVGMGGLTTGGGIGFMVRKYGLAIDNLLAAQVVTAAGEIVTASAAEHPDLFWAIRGGGGNFGIVTEFTFRLAPVGEILGGELLLPASREVLRGYLDYVAAAPDDLTTIANLMHAPPAPHVPRERVGELALSILVCWTGSVADGERALAPLRALATPIADVVAPIPYPAIYRFTAVPPHAAAARMLFADRLSDASLDAALEAVRQAPSPFCIVQFRGLGGAMARVAADATAFAHRERRYFVTLLGLWLDAAEDGVPYRRWTDALWQELRPEARGVYVNFLEDEGEARIHEAYPPATYARLAAIKAKYDPENLFRFNQNIPPQS
ncbi:MAG TPA: FAD-binding oxidoreductase [Thermomicrobiaceae bacterium]|nr:FAD-binding oxidoreductase [Thermomicrobiaceae bacterium]